MPFLGIPDDVLMGRRSALDWWKERALAAETELEALSAAAPQWISVADRLPETGIDVLIVSGGFVSLAWYDPADGWINNAGEPTHWMQLPEPPK